MSLSRAQKAFLIILIFAGAVIGFMIKLPSGFRHIDKELHAAFYFLAAALLNILLAKRNLLIHAFLFVALFLFGVAIEYSQEYSNKFLHRQIHGRFDPADVKANLTGLIAFSVLWIIYAGFSWLRKGDAGKQTT